MIVSSFSGRCIYLRDSYSISPILKSYTPKTGDVTPLVRVEIHIGFYSRQCKLPSVGQDRPGGFHPHNSLPVVSRELPRGEDLFVPSPYAPRRDRTNKHTRTVWSVKVTGRYNVTEGPYTLTCLDGSTLAHRFYPYQIT